MGAIMFVIFCGLLLVAMVDPSWVAPVVLLGLAVWLALASRGRR